MPRYPAHQRTLPYSTSCSLRSTLSTQISPRHSRTMSNTRSLDPKVWARLAIFVLHDPANDPLARQRDIALAMSRAYLPALDYFNTSSAELRLCFWEDEFEKFVMTLPLWTRKQRYEVEYYYAGLDAMVQYIGDVRIHLTYEHTPVNGRMAFWSDVVAKAMKLVTPQLRSQM